MIYLIQVFNNLVNNKRSNPIVNLQRQNDLNNLIESLYVLCFTKSNFDKWHDFYIETFGLSDHTLTNSQRQLVLPAV